MESSRFTVHGSKRYILFAVCCLLTVSLTGCAMLKESAKEVAGVSTKVLEEKRKGAIKKTFTYDFNVCYDKVKNTLKRIGCYIYAEDIKNKMIAFYVSESDTTDVGIFFEEIDASNTRVEVSSPSTYAKEFIAGTVFKALGPQEKQAVSDAPKETQSQ